MNNRLNLNSDEMLILYTLVEKELRRSIIEHNEEAAIMLGKLNLKIKDYITYHGLFEINNGEDNE